ncbi:hypothetical protein D3C87_1898010 [compost metagenome]
MGLVGHVSHIGRGAIGAKFVGDRTQGYRVAVLALDDAFNVHGWAFLEVNGRKGAEAPFTITAW